MNEKPDVRRTVRVERDVDGAAIGAALIRISKALNRKYVEKLLLDIDGEKTFKIGIFSEYPYEDVIIRTGENLENVGIKWDRMYNNFCVGSTNWPGEKHPVGYENVAVVEAVEEVRDNLERLLKEGN